MVRLIRVLGVAVFLGLGAAGAAGGDAPALFPPPADLIDNIPGDFPRFHFAGHGEDAALLNRYLWHHFSARLGHSPVLFNKEYLTTSDQWMGGAMHPGWPAPVQDIQRDDLLAVRLDPDGYVWTNQHFSHAHEQGWPFPMWTQGPTGPEGFGAGWHFQEDGPGWVWDALRRQPESPFAREKALDGWELVHCESRGIVEGKWHLAATGPSPMLVTPEGPRIIAFNAPFLQLRWTRSGTPAPGQLPYVEWMRKEDAAFSPERRVHFGFDSGNPDYERVTGTTHSMITMHTHPQWDGEIKRIRIALAPGESGGEFAIDSFFTVYDTRHTINNPIYIMACWNYYRWSGDLAFLRAVINNMRQALRYQQTTLGGLTHNRIRNEWIGHTGISGLELSPDGTKTIHYGQGIGSNYWDLLPFGWDDLYATNQYYASLRIMAELEDAIRAHPEWDIPGGELAFDPGALRKHADDVKAEANRLFWNPETGRFHAVIDKNGHAHDYGFTFLNLDAIWYGLASEEHAQSIMDWLTGARLVEGDTSMGADIYHWRFGPRATTRRNVEWYGFMWTGPETIPWGGQVQDGGAVLGFTFYDLWARLHVLGPDNAWARLREILAWEKEVWEAGGYREYYKDGLRGTTLQGGGTAGGLGIDFEFFESSLLPSIVTYGFLGLEPGADALRIAPRLPGACPEMGLANLQYRRAALDVLATASTLSVALKTMPAGPLWLELPPDWRGENGTPGPRFTLSAPGLYRFTKPETPGP